MPRLSGLSPHRSPHVRTFLETVRKLARHGAINVRDYEPKQIWQALGSPLRLTKHGLAMRVADYFQELRRKVPTPRKPWQPQDLRMSAFYAVALALTANRKRSVIDLNQAAEHREH